jgi:hypothetical protein
MRGAVLLKGDGGGSSAAGEEGEPAAKDEIYISEAHERLVVL